MALKTYYITTQYTFERFFGDGSGSVVVPSGVYIFYPDPRDGVVVTDTNGRPLYNENKCYILRNMVRLSSNTILRGVGNSNQVIIVRDTSQSNVQFTTSYEIQKTGCSNTSGSDVINVPDTSGLVSGHPICYVSNTGNVIGYYKIMNIGTDSIKVDTTIGAAYSNATVFVLTKDIILENIIIDGRSNVNGLGGSNSYLLELFNLSYCTQFVFEKGVLQNASATNGAGAYLRYSSLVKLNISDCYATSSGGGAYLEWSYFNKISIKYCTSGNVGGAANLVNSSYNRVFGYRCRSAGGIIRLVSSRCNRLTARFCVSTLNRGDICSLESNSLYNFIYGWNIVENNSTRTLIYVYTGGGSYKKALGHFTRIDTNGLVKADNSTQDNNFRNVSYTL